jgi:hypothetical protein
MYSATKPPSSLHYAPKGLWLAQLRLSPVLTPSSDA